MWKTYVFFPSNRDISFLYDVPKEEIPEEEPSKFDPSGERKRELTIMREEKKEKEEKEVRLPDSLIPEEYHIVKRF